MTVAKVSRDKRNKRINLLQDADFAWKISSKNKRRGKKKSAVAKPGK